MVAWLTFLVANSAVTLGAIAILARLRKERGPLDSVLFLLLRLGLISGAILLAGLAHVLTPIGLGLAAGVALAGLLLSGVHRNLVAFSFPEVGVAAGIFAALAAAQLLAQVWFFAPYFGDALSYHLPKVAEWVRAGAFTREMGVDTHVTFPAGFELVETWWVVFFRHDVLIEMAGVEFLALAVSSVYALARKFQLPERAAFFAALAYGMTPGLYLQATSCLNDGAVAAMVVATTALILSDVSLGVVLLAAGLGFGVKPTYAYALVGLGFLWLITRQSRERRPFTSRLEVVLASGAILIGLFWFVRNLAWYGSPTFPVGKGGLPGAHPIQFGPKLSSLWGNLSQLVGDRVYDDQSPYGPLVIGITGWGALSFGLGGIALVHHLRFDPGFRRLATAFAISLCTVLASVLVDPWSMRFVLFFPAIMAVSVARLALQSRGFAALAALALIAQFLGTALPGQLSREAFVVMGREGWRERSLAKATGACHQSEAVGYFVDNRNVAYLLYRPDFSSRVVYLRSRTPEGLLEDADRGGVKLIYAASATLEHRELVQECERRGRLKKVGRNFFAVQ